MFLHRNSALTPVKRAELVDFLSKGMSLAAASRHFGVSVPTVRRWRDRAREQSLPFLGDRSCRPRTSPAATPAPVREQVVLLRLQEMNMRDIARSLGTSLSTVSRILKGKGLSRLRDLQPKDPDNRYEHPEPGDMLHVDTKKLNRFDFPGHKVTADRSKSNRPGLGTDCVFVAVDDHSRIAFSAVYPDESKQSAAHFLEQVLGAMDELGAPVKRVLTDKAMVFRSDLVKDVMKRHGSVHKTTRPYRPRTNGKAERFIQTILREWAYGKPYRNSRERNEALRQFIQWYNAKRPHSALQGKPPVTRITKLLKHDT
ncbi:MAG: IS481 family transposase [Armatimonadaceae bacterium]